MSKLALLGGKPVSKTDILGKTELITRPDLERKYLLETYDSGVWDDWPENPGTAAKFQTEWAEFNKSKYCALLTNGTHTLQVALETLDIGAGDEVIVPGLTWQATASVVCDVNAVPVLVDVDPETLCIDPAEVEAAVTPRTKAIIPVHLYDRMADMSALKKIAKKHGLFIVEDCAHTHGSTWKGKGAGTIGDFGSYSFQRSKLMTGAEGGALLMQKADYFWKVVSQRSCGREYKKGTRIHSGNYRMTGFQAAILRGQLAAMKKNVDVIHRNGIALDEAVAQAPGVAALRRDKHVTRQSGYGYVFLYDKEAYDGLDGATFRKALSAEVGRYFGSTYEPLNHSELYTPHLKKRHYLSKSYHKAITPSRWDLPASEALWADRAIVTDWSLLGTKPSRTHILTDAITKIYENRKDLL